MKPSVLLLRVLGLITMVSGHAMSGAAGSASANQTLDGAWRIAPDEHNVGREEHWFDAVRGDSRDTPVPGIIQETLVGYHGVAWYWHSFRVERRPAGADGL